MKEKMLIASGNKGKIREIKEYFQEINFHIIGLYELPAMDEVVEDGKTFKENALKKARVRARETGLLTLADDSGLVVDALDGRPGVYSARYAGDEASDEDNNHKLLKELDGLSREERTARFKCVMALVDPLKGKEYTVTGTCEGIIISEPRGENGFGYDPLFYVPDFEKTMAELPLEIKNKISHRAHALKKMKEILKEEYSNT